jgi:dTDP-4-amino-4,6-dideoxygalactose transaminase
MNIRGPSRRRNGFRTVERDLRGVESFETFNWMIPVYTWRAPSSRIVPKASSDFEIPRRGGVNPQQVALTDPFAGYQAHREEIQAAIARVLDRGRYILGPEVAAFEEEFAQYVGVTDAVGVGSGTDALTLALRALQLPSGSGVATVAHTAVATVAAIEAAGLIPLLADIDPVHRTLSPESLAHLCRVATGRSDAPVRAVIPVHLHGHPADLPGILAVARQYGLAVIEDCAQAHGARLNGRTLGSWSDLAAFSFYPTKNLGALGDGGAIVTNNRALAQRARLLREYGWDSSRVATIPGGNSRLDELQAAILRVKLKYLDGENQARRRLASEYDRRLTGTSLRLPVVREGASPVYHHYVVSHFARDSLRKHLAERGIGTGVHYPVPIHRQPAYAGRFPLLVPLPSTEQAAQVVLSLPMYPQLSIQTVDRLVVDLNLGVAQSRAED